MERTKIIRPGVLPEALQKMSKSKINFRKLIVEKGGGVAAYNKLYSRAGNRRDTEVDEFLEGIFKICPEFEEAVFETESEAVSESDAIDEIRQKVDRLLERFEEVLEADDYKKKYLEITETLAKKYLSGRDLE